MLKSSQILNPRPKSRDLPTGLSSEGEAAGGPHPLGNLACGMPELLGVREWEGSFEVFPHAELQKAGLLSYAESS